MFHFAPCFTVVNLEAFRKFCKNPVKMNNVNITLQVNAGRSLYTRKLRAM